MAYKPSSNYKEDEISLARFAKALGHPARIAIMKYLTSLDTCCFGDINKELPIAKATVSQHLTELKDAGLIKGSIDPPKVNYCVNKESWNKAKHLFEKIFYNNDIENTNKKCCN